MTKSVSPTAAIAVVVVLLALFGFAVVVVSNHHGGSAVETAARGQKSGSQMMQFMHRPQPGFVPARPNQNPGSSASR